MKTYRSPIRRINFTLSSFRQIFLTHQWAKLTRCNSASKSFVGISKIFGSPTSIGSSTIQHFYGPATHMCHTAYRSPPTTLQFFLFLSQCSNSVRFIYMYSAWCPPRKRRRQRKYDRRVRAPRTAVNRLAGSFLFPHCIVLKCCELCLLYDHQSTAHIPCSPCARIMLAHQSTTREKRKNRNVFKRFHVILTHLDTI